MTTTNTLSIEWEFITYFLEAAVELKSIVIVPNTRVLCNLKQLTVTVYKFPDWEVGEVR